MKSSRLQWQIALAAALGVVVGSVVDESVTVAGLPLSGFLDFLGAAFVSALKMLVVPLVGASLVVGIAGIATGRALARLGLRTISLFLVTSIAAILLGMALVTFAEPGLVNGAPARDLLAAAGSSADMGVEFAEPEVDDLLDVFLSIVPANVFSAAAGDDLLGVIFFSVLFGFFMARLDHDYAEPLFRFWSAIAQVMTRMTGWVVAFTPVGVFALVARAVGRGGGETLAPLAAFVALVLAAMVLHALVTLPVLLRVLGRVSPWSLYRVAAPVVVTAASTGSAFATLPMSMERMENGAGVSGRVSGLVLPLGAALNLNGTALYNCAAAVFLAQAYGVALDPGSQIAIVAVGIVASIGVGGNPAGSLLAISIILTAIGAPAEGVGALFVADRLLEMARTGVNVLADMVCAVLLARLNGEQTRVAAGAAAEA